MCIQSITVKLRGPRAQRPWLGEAKVNPALRTILDLLTSEVDHILAEL